MSNDNFNNLAGFETYRTECQTAAGRGVTIFFANPYNRLIPEVDEPWEPVLDNES